MYDVDGNGWIDLPEMTKIGEQEKQSQPDLATVQLKQTHDNTLRYTYVYLKVCIEERKKYALIYLTNAEQKLYFLIEVQKNYT